MNKRTVLLTGAGAVIPWGAPSTTQITKDIVNDKSFISATGQPSGQWIYHKLLGFYNQDKDSVTFEIILNAIEYLNTFFSSKERNSKVRYTNVMPAFLEIKDDIQEILCFDRIYKKQVNVWVSKNELTPSYWYDNASFL